MKMHSVMILQRQYSTLLCFLLLTLTSWRSSTAWAEKSVLPSKAVKSTGLDRLKEVLMEENKTSYPNTLWLTANKLRKKRDTAAEKNYLHNHKYKSSAKSENHRHVPLTLSWPPPQNQETHQENHEFMEAHLRAAGRDMAVQMMSKRRNMPGGGRLYDVPQIGKSNIQN